MPMRDVGRLSGCPSKRTSPSVPSMTRDEALEMGRKGRLAALSDRDQPSKFKIDIIENIPPGETISLYRNGEFIDLCAGPHVMRTGNIGAFRLTSVASASG